MSELRELYERETGKKPYRYTTITNENLGTTADYVAWLERRDDTAVAILQGALDRGADLQRKVDELERRAASAEQLAEACSHAHQYVLANAEDACDYRLAEELNAALAAHEAACKEKS